MKYTYASLPLMLTRTPSKLVGSLPFTISEAAQVRVAPERRKPWMLTHAPGVAPAANAAAFTTPLRVETTGALPGGASSGVKPITTSNVTRFSPIDDVGSASIGRITDC